MHQHGVFSYTENNDYQVLELPYAGEALSMVVFLPRSPDKLNRLEESLTLEKLLQTIRALQSTKVKVFLLRFKLTAEYHLEKTLPALGMRDAFSRQKADFTGTSLERPPLFISQVLQKTFAEVKEQGTEAAAVTVIIEGAAAAPGISEPPIPLFRADHPFMFLIRHRPSNCILFMGRVTNPPPAGDK